MNRPTIALLLGSLVVSIGCKKPPPPAAPLAAGSPAAAKPMPAQIPPVLARVNGEAINKWEFDDAVRRIEAMAGSPVPPDRRDEVLRGALDQLVAYHLIAQEARTRNMGPTDADVEARIAKIKGNFPNDDAFQQGIAAQGLTVEEAVHARHILIGVPADASAADRSKARQTAQSVVGQLKRGAKFEDIAQKLSTDTGSAQNGGDVGFFPKGQMTPAFEQAAFALKPGQTSGVVETPFGFHVIRTIERREERTAPFEEVNGQIKEFLTRGQREKKLADFVTQLKTKARIELLV